MKNTKQPQNPFLYPSFDIDYQESATQGRNVINHEHKGATLRDEFAGLAMKSIIAPWAEALGGGNVSPEAISSFSKAAYQVADAMLSERERENIKP